MTSYLTPELEKCVENMSDKDKITYIEMLAKDIINREGCGTSACLSRVPDLKEVLVYMDGMLIYEQLKAEGYVEPDLEQIRIDAGWSEAEISQGYRHDSIEDVPGWSAPSSLTVNTFTQNVSAMIIIVLGVVAFVLMFLTGRSKK